VSARRPGGRTRELIVVEAARLFALKGYEGASISDIALATGVSKPALYHHFADKDEIYTDIVVSVLAAMVAHARQSTAGIEDPVEKLRCFILAHAVYFEQHRYAFIAAQLGFRGLRSADGRDVAVEHRDAYEAILRDILKEADRAGALMVPDVATAGRLILSALNWMARWYQADGSQTASQIATDYANLLLNGMLPRSSPVRRSQVARR